MFDIGLGELLLLVVAALFVFGPDRLPAMAAQAVRTLRALREMATSARNDINDAIGPELRELDPRQDLGALRDLNPLGDLNPRTALNRFVLDTDPDVPRTPASGPSSGTSTNGNGSARPVSFDPDAT